MGTTRFSRPVPRTGRVLAGCRAGPGLAHPSDSRARRQRPPFYRWFPDGEINVAHNALDRHVDAGPGDRAALIYDSPVTGTKRTFTYTQLRDEVATFAGVLRDLGVTRGTGW